MKLLRVHSDCDGNKVNFNFELKFCRNSITFYSSPPPPADKRTELHLGLQLIMAETEIEPILCPTQLERKANYKVNLIVKGWSVF